MLYYDDRDYLNYEDIDDLYEDEIIFEQDATDLQDSHSSWEYDYHNLTNELVDD